VIEARREPPDAPAARTLFMAYMALVRERLGPGFEPSEDVFATADAFRGPGSAWLVLYEDGVPVACGGLRPLTADAAEIKRMFVAPGARGRGLGRRLLGELEAIAHGDGRRRIRLVTTDALAEARALYRSAGYAVASADEQDGHTDYWLEKRL
jgi:GNAT superfamily N-acetyltransferase